MSEEKKEGETATAETVTPPAPATTPPDEKPKAAAPKPAAVKPKATAPAKPKDPPKAEVKKPEEKPETVTPKPAETKLADEKDRAAEREVLAAKKAAREEKRQADAAKAAANDPTYAQLVRQRDLGTTAEERGEANEQLKDLLELEIEKAAKSFDLVKAVKNDRDFRIAFLRKLENRAPQLTKELGDLETGRK